MGCRAEKCCCCSLQKGVFIWGIIIIVLALLNGLSGALQMMPGLRYILTTFFNVVLGILLIIGAKIENRRIILAYLVLDIIWMVAEVIYIIVLAFTESTKHLVGVPIVLIGIIPLYFVCSYYKQLKENEAT